MLINKNIVVIGSTNMDMVVNTNHFPVPGETVLGGKFYMNLGGKGANQAVAAARLGAQVAFITCVGDDIFGHDALTKLKQQKIEISYAQKNKEVRTGIALITVDESAENTIVVASGANERISFDDTTVLKKMIGKDTIVLMQLEIPITAIQQVCDYVVEVGATLILNPAPANDLPSSILEKVNIITPNQTEARILSGIEVIDQQTAVLAAERILAMGPAIVIITMGDKGAYVKSKTTSFFKAAYPVQAVDSTAAGDVFNGALAYSLTKSDDLEIAIEMANKAAALAVTRLGAQDSAPTLEEISKFYSNNSYSS